MGQLPDGDAAPVDGALPASAAPGAAERGFGAYLHVPFCRVRCGYCDFNTYTSTELRGAKQADYADQAIAEVRLAGRVLDDLAAHDAAVRRPLSTVFVGGGTPTLLPPGDLGRMLAAVRDEWGLAEGTEVTTEANPDSVDADDLRVLADAGFTRVSFGMQSAVPHVLATLDRTHDPARVPLVVQWAKDAGLDVSVDLIYGTPGESLDDWQRSLDAALSYDVDHLSAYALIVEDGTALARRIRRGEIAPVDDDLHAAMYEAADASLGAAGYDWYEVSNWARGGAVSRHNLSYWLGHDWWGIGPGAHSHVGGVRWWNVKHPAAYAQRLAAGESPALAREVLDDDTRRVERVLLETRIRAGLPIEALDADGRAAVAGLIAEGLVDGASALRGRVVPTDRGRLLADTVVRRLTAST
ncbi:radical SAM family heme chaperone HemW [Agrococcus jejuensis]|uniref:Heme chaperone HemW n=1 Tax=Agrococcus jejuensis TaxID=399736 RepID=A0A1G8A435_9MICO|nr:coproporphyrinogen III oxidase, anaerobic [Agrococcus jejuensis]